MSATRAIFMAAIHVITFLMTMVLTWIYTEENMQFIKDS